MAVTIKYAVEGMIRCTNRHPSLCQCNIVLNANGGSPIEIDMLVVYQRSQETKLRFIGDFIRPIVVPRTDAFHGVEFLHGTIVQSNGCLSLR